MLCSYGANMKLTHRIKPKHLELVLKIAETEQLQLAAQAVAMSQPAASRILADLEASLGSALFIRHPSGMEPTPAGHVLIRHARVVLSELATMGEELTYLQTGAAGNVRIGAVTGPAVGYLMPALKEVYRQHPDLRVSVDVAPSAVLFRHLEEARYDFILGRVTPGHDTRDLRLYPARSEIVSLLVHESHPLAGQDRVALEALTDFPWVIQEEGSPIRDAVEQAFHASGVPVPTRVLNSSSLLVALAQVAEGRAIAPQTEEVKNLLVSREIDARLVALNLQLDIIVTPYFVVQSNRRRLSRAAEIVLSEVLARL